MKYSDYDGVVHIAAIRAYMSYQRGALCELGPLYLVDYRSDELHHTDRPVTCFICLITPGRLDV